MVDNSEIEEIFGASDGDPLFNTSSLDFHNDKFENHNEISSMEVSTIFGPYEQGIQHVESESNINDHVLLEPKFDKPMDEHEWNSNNNKFT